MFRAFIYVRESGDDESSVSGIVSAAKANMLKCDKRMRASHVSFLVEPWKSTLNYISNSLIGYLLVNKDSNWKFWANFVFCDMLSCLLCPYVVECGG